MLDTNIEGHNMAATATQAAPTSPHGGGPSFSIMEDASTSASTRANTPSSKHSTPVAREAVPLVSSKMANVRNNTNTKKLKSDQKIKQKYDQNTDAPKSSSVDTLLHSLSEQQVEYENRKRSGNLHNSTASTQKSKTDDSIAPKDSKKNPALPYDVKETKTLAPKPTLEVERLKKELDEAKSKIARQEIELSETRFKGGPSEQSINNMQDAYTAQRPSCMASDDARSDVSDAMSVSSFQSRPRMGYVPPNATAGPYNQSMPGPGIWSQAVQRPFSNRAMQPNVPPLSIPQAGGRSYGAQISPMSADSIQSMPGYNYGVFSARGGGTRGNRGTVNLNSGSAWGSVTSDEWSPIGGGGGFPPPGAMTPLQSPMGAFQAPMAAYQPRAVGAPLSATAADFNASGSVPWETRPSSPAHHTYAPPIEPMNYRRMLDKTVSCNWKYIVDKIIHNNDQQASIFLQQKLKVGTAEQKCEIVNAIIAQAYSLMINRFGNFLVQRCFEHGTPEQVSQIAEAIRGHTLPLSMDPFGCHVIQKAFDAVPESFKAVMVRELLRQIPETVVHRYACHVWQKLFELRWSDSPPQIMKYVNEALKGMWHEVALGETGSLVVQNIFENCLEEDKRPCIEEVLNSIDVVAHGQFGNWCIQHVCEHGAPADRTRAVDHVLRYAPEYSMDQFASKVVEKCLKIGGPEFLDRYLTRVCEGRPDRPRIPLIDIASDQYGNYLIQYILTHAGAQHRELVASHIRKHMVSLRGSKFGSRVGMLCSNPAYATRPGPSMSTPSSRFPVNSNGFNPGVVSSSVSGTSGAGTFTNPVNGGNSRYASNFR